MMLHTQMLNDGKTSSVNLYTMYVHTCVYRCKRCSYQTVIPLIFVYRYKRCDHQAVRGYYLFSVLR